MLNPEKTEIIIAGPGVGKTTELLNRVEKALLEGVPPVEIAFFSFSTTAVNEGLDRIIKRMNYKKNNFRYFKTLHAMAFSLLGLDTKQIISYGLMRQFAKENELKLNSIDYKTGVARYQTPDSILLSQIDSARLLGMTVREFFIKQHIDNVSIAHAEDIAAKYQKFKMANGVIDFTDMLLFANESVQDTPHFRYMFIDEAQDLSTQQWKFVEKMATNADNVVIVGDERQAIAEFAGADVDYFLKVKGTLTELNRSYRVPRKIFNLARKIEKKMIKVRDSVWYPRGADPGEADADGEIIRVNNLPIREMARGTWAVLTRTNSQLTEFKEYMMQNCHLLPAFFLVDGQPPIDEEIFKAISIFEGVTTKIDISKYDFILPDANDSEEKARKKVRYINLMKKFMSSKAPGTAELDTVFMHRFDYKNWTDAFDKVPLAERRYIAAILPVYKKHPDAFDKAKIRLSTIHSSKGTEADNVVLYTSLTSKVYNEWKRFAGTDDTEAKVLFVGVTRARKRLYLLGDKKAKYSYEEMIE